MRKIIGLSLGFLLPLISFSCLAEEPKQLSLEESMEVAFKNNKRVLGAKEMLREAKGNLITARAGFLPTISIQPTYTRIGVPFSIKMPEMDMVIGGEESYSVRASVQQPVFTWGRVSSGYRLARANLKAQEEDYRRERNNLRFNVSKSFYGVLLAEELAKLSEESYAQMERHYKQVENLYQNGMASKLDLLRAEIQLADIKPQVIRARNGFKLAQVSFNTLLGLEPEIPVELEGELKYESFAVDLEESIRNALKHRPEVISLRERKKMARSGIALARAGNKPSLLAIYNYQYQKPFHWKEEWGEDWNVGLALNFPVFSGFSNYGEVVQAKSQLEQVQFAIDELKDGIRLGVTEIYLRMEQEKETIISQEKNVKQAEEILGIAEERYRNGMITNLEYMDTQLALTRAKTTYLQALANHLIAKAQFTKAMGR